MRAMKRTVSVLLSLLMIVGMVSVLGISTASAAETNTVTYTSNLGTAAGTIEYTPGTTETVTVTYNLTTATPIINAQGVMTYDKNVLAIHAGQTAATVCPNLNSTLAVNLTKTDGRIPFVASDFQTGFDFSQGAVFMTVVFDVIGSGDTTVNLAVDTLRGTAQLGTSSARDVIFVSDGVLDDDAAMTAASTAAVYPEADDNMDDFLYIVGANLKGKVGFQFMFRSAPAGYTASSLSVTFDGPDDSEDGTVQYTKIPAAGKVNGVSVRYRTYFLMASYLTQPVTITVKQGNEVLATRSLTLEEVILDSLATSTDQNKNNLFKALLNYGGYSQLYTNKFTDNLANKNIDSTLAPMSSIDVPAGVSASHPTVSDLGLSLYRDGAELGQQNAINLYYKVTDETKFANASATIDGQAAEFVDTGATMGGKRLVLLKVSDIAAKDMDSVHTVQFSNNKTYKVCIYKYLNARLAADNTDTISRAMYEYSQAAKVYFAA